MEYQKGRLYYLPRLLDSKGSLETGAIIRYDPEILPGGVKIIGKMLLDVHVDLFPIHEFSLTERSFDERLVKEIPGFSLKLAVPLPNALMKRKIKKPTKISEARLRLFRGVDRTTGIPWTDVFRVRRNLERKQHRTDEEELLLTKLNNTHDNLLWLIMLERVSEQIAIALRQFSLTRGDHARRLKREEERILRTLPTQRIIDRAIMNNTFDIEAGFSRRVQSLQSPDGVVTSTPSPRTPHPSIEYDDVGLMNEQENTYKDSPTYSPPPSPEALQEPEEMPEPPITPPPPTPAPEPEVESEVGVSIPVAGPLPLTSTPPPPTPTPAPEPKVESGSEVSLPPQPTSLPEQPTTPATPSEPEGEEESDIIQEAEQDMSVEKQAEDIIRDDDIPDIPVIEATGEPEKEPADEIPLQPVLFEDDKDRDFSLDPEEADTMVHRLEPENIERTRRIRAKITELDNTNVSELYTKYNKALELYKKDIFNRKLENVVNTLGFFLEMKTEDHSQEVGGYPTYHNESFQKEITQRQDFYPYKMEDSGIPILDRIQEIEDNPFTSKFKLQNHQRYISQFLSSDTPYNSLLVYHEVGTGKTCMAIQVAEMYLAENNNEKRAIVIAPIAVQPGFRREIFDAGKLDTDDPTSQCTGDVYTNNIGDVFNTNSVLRRFQDLVKSRYDIYGYGTFERMFEKEIIEPAERSFPENIAKQSKMMIDKIAEVFGDGMIIVDEVHNIRDPEEKKKIMRYLMLIARFSYNTRILLMSATPMYNRSAEILPILNILRLNEGLSPIPMNLVFEDGLITREGEDVLRETARGFVSYLRGENPIDFPVRLSPPDNVMEDRNPRPILDMRGESIDNDLPTGKDILPIVRVPLREDMLISRVYRDEMEAKSEGGRKLIAPSAATGLKQTAVCVFPNGNSGAEGFNETFIKSATSSKKGLLRLRDQTKRDSGMIDKESKMFLHPDRIYNYAPKIAEITKLAVSANGIVMIFTENIQGSAIPIGIALEQLGFQRYGDDPLLSLPTDAVKPTESMGYNGLTRTQHIEKGMNASDWAPAMYTIISADPYITKRRDKIIRRTSASDNARGQVIKVIIATEAISEGVNFKNIREVHITDAHYHISLMDQVVGRAQRFRSHKLLPPNERNVNVYAWGVSWDKTHPYYGKETADEELYRFAEEKSVEVGKIARILKENSFDCHLTNDVNNRVSEAYDQDTIMIDAQGNERQYNFADIPGSRECDYQESCAIQCATELDDPKTLKSSFMSEGIAQDAEIRREIRIFMLLVSYTTLNSLIDHIRKEIPGIQKRQIERVIYDMVVDKSRILAPNEGIFTLQSRHMGDDIILTLEPTEITDSRAPMLDRISRVRRKPEYIMAPEDTPTPTLPLETGDIEPDTTTGEPAHAVVAPEVSPLSPPSGESGVGWEDTYYPFRAKFAITWEGIVSGSVGGGVGASMIRAMSMVDGIPMSIWAVVLCENLEEMADPVKRKDILRGIAMEPEDTASSFRMIRDEYVKSGEIILPGRRDSRTRIRTMNTTGNIELIIAETGEIVSTMPVPKKTITYGFYTYRAQGTQKQKRGEPDGMLRLFLQSYRVGMSRVARGYYPDTSVAALAKTYTDLYVPGTGIVIDECTITDEVLVREFKQRNGMESAKEMFKTKNVDIVKIISEACTRKSDKYRPPTEWMYRIET